MKVESFLFWLLVGLQACLNYLNSCSNMQNLPIYSNYEFNKNYQ